MKLRFLTVMILLTVCTFNGIAQTWEDFKRAVTKDRRVALFPKYAVKETEPPKTEEIDSIEHNTAEGRICLHFSLPYINSFHFKPVNEGIKNHIGFMGYSIGLDYYYQLNRYVHLSYSAIQDYFLPIIFVERQDEYKMMQSSVFHLSNNYKFYLFHLGYGIVFTRNSWKIVNVLWEENSTTRKPVTKNNFTIGPALSAYYQIDPIGYIGIVYRSALFSSNSASIFKYEHSISIDMGIKVQLTK